MYVLTLVCAFLIWCIYDWFVWWKNIFRHMEKLPGPRWLPLFGTTYAFIGLRKQELPAKFLEIVKKYKPIFRTWMGTDAELHLIKPEYLEAIMKSTTQLSKGKSYYILQPWLGEGLLLSKGTKWQAHRKLITPAFHFTILENFMEVFVEKSKYLIKYLETKADGGYFDISNYITNCALDIICETAMGVSVNALSNSHNDYVKSIHDISAIMVWRALRPYVKWDFLFYCTPRGRQFKKCVKTLHNFSNKVIADRRRLYQEERAKRSTMVENDDVLGKKKRLSFLDILLEASEEKNILSAVELREEVDTFIFAGHDTTTAAICWSLFLLGNHPDIQEKVYAELNNVLEEKPTPSTLGELHQLKYLECVIKEALRMYPSVPFILRTLTDDVEIGGYKIPAGVNVVLHIMLSMRDPANFLDPDKFDPDRFLPENSQGRHPYAFIPFSAGPRNCIGQKFAMYEEKTILASILKNFKVTAQEDHVEVFIDIILRSQSGFKLKLEKRAG